jgi:hypothetical protein
VAGGALFLALHHREAGTHYYEVRAPTYEVTIASEDKRNYSVASNGRL